MQMGKVRSEFLVGRCSIAKRESPASAGFVSLGNDRVEIALQGDDRLLPAAIVKVFMVALV